jgi:DNA polymerase-3 subunit gamma/tau
MGTIAWYHRAMAAHEALYRKYRPRSFSDLVGQTQVSRTLEHALREGRISHAYLFTGPRGTGKTSSARILATSLNCVEGPTPNPCGRCESCLAIRQGHHLDVIEIDAASNRSVDDARDLRERVRFAPTAGRYKVFIIDEVHMLTREAFNALLKTLEEPPPNLVFILATTDIHQVLPTVTSRCQRYDFRPIPNEALIARLEEVARLEGFGVEAGGLHAIARKAAGGLRDALSILDQVRAFSRDECITTREVLDSLGMVPQDVLVGLLEDLGKREIVPTLERLQGVLDHGLPAGLVLRELIESLRHLLVARASGWSTPEPGIRDPLVEVLSEPLRLGLPALLAHWQGPEILWAIEVLRETERSMRTSHQDTLWLEVALIRLSDRPRVASLIELEQRVTAIEQRLAQGPVPPPRTGMAPRPTVPAAPAPERPAASPDPVSPVAGSPSPAPVAAPPSQPPTPTPPAGPLPEASDAGPGGGEDILPRFIASLQSVHVTTHSLAQQHAISARLEGKRLHLAVKALVNLFEQRRPHLVKAAVQAFGEGVEVTLTLESGGGTASDPRRAGVGLGPATPASSPRPTSPDAAPRSEPVAPPVASVEIVTDPAPDLSPSLPVPAPCRTDGSEERARQADEPGQDLIERTLEFFNGRLVPGGD